MLHDNRLSPGECGFKHTHRETGCHRYQCHHRKDRQRCRRRLPAGRQEQPAAIRIEVGFQGCTRDSFVDLDEAHGRIEKRTVTVSRETDGAS